METGVTFANWSLYMSPNRTELVWFTRETGIEVRYLEAIEEMDPWYAQIQPVLTEGRNPGFDLMVITNGIRFRQLVDAGLLAPLDHSRLPNFAANAGESYRDRSYDPGNVYSVPWASGVTGIAYNPAFVEEEPASLGDLWQPRFRGKVGMYADLSELGSFGLLALGIDPATSTPDQWQRAADHLRRQRDMGNVHRYYTTSDVDALERGDVWVMQAWAGDIFQKNLADGTDLRFVVPREGATIWTDNFAIPVTANRKAEAMALIDFFYRVDVAASLTEYINYITPVPAAQRLIREHAAAESGPRRRYLSRVAESRLVFPTRSDYHNLHYYRDFHNQGERLRYQAIFAAVVRP